VFAERIDSHRLVEGVTDDDGAGQHQYGQRACD
jgi:hypothetical protein